MIGQSSSLAPNCSRPLAQVVGVAAAHPFRVRMACVTIQVARKFTTPRTLNTLSMPKSSQRLQYGERAFGHSAHRASTAHGRSAIALRSDGEGDHSSQSRLPAMFAHRWHDHSRSRNLPSHQITADHVLPDGPSRPIAVLIASSVMNTRGSTRPWRWSARGSRTCVEGLQGRRKARALVAEHASDFACAWLAHCARQVVEHQRLDTSRIVQGNGNDLGNSLSSK